jgi:hypothetical protein
VSKTIKSTGNIQFVTSIGENLNPNLIYDVIGIQIFIDGIEWD